MHVHVPQVVAPTASTWKWWRSLHNRSHQVCITQRIDIQYSETSQSQTMYQAIMILKPLNTMQFYMDMFFCDCLDLSKSYVLYPP